MSGHEISENGLDMVCWSVKVIRVVFSSSMRHVFEYFDALSTKVLAMGTICSRKTNVLNLMAGHLIREHIIKTAKEMPVKLDHYACKSSLGINYIL